MAFEDTDPEIDVPGFPCEIFEEVAGIFVVFTNDPWTDGKDIPSRKPHDETGWGVPNGAYPAEFRVTFEPALEEEESIGTKSLSVHRANGFEILRHHRSDIRT